MLTKRLVATAVAVALTGAPALASPTYIASLGHAPLVGRIDSTGELKADMSRYDATFAKAARKLGLSDAQYKEFKLASPTPVILPRHLDAMTWSDGRNVKILYDVMIPANTVGWEVDLHSGNQILALLVPRRCGNLSLVIRQAPHIAQAPRPTAVAPAPAPPAPVPPPEEVAAAPVEQPEAVPAPAAAFPPPVKHASPLWLGGLIPLIFGIAGGGGGGGGGSTGGPPTLPCP